MWHHNSDSHQKLVVKLGCWPGRFAARFSLPLQMEASECCSPSLGGPKLLFWAKDSHWPPSCDTKILIRIKIQWSNSGFDLVVLLYDSHSCANGCLELIVQGTWRPYNLPLWAKESLLSNMHWSIQVPFAIIMFWVAGGNCVYAFAWWPPPRQT